MIGGKNLRKLGWLAGELGMALQAKQSRIQCSRLVRVIALGMAGERPVASLALDLLMALAFADLVLVRVTIHAHGLATEPDALNAGIGQRPTSVEAVLAEVPGHERLSHDHKRQEPGREQAGNAHDVLIPGG
jgi:hypothetical protein